MAIRDLINFRIHFRMPFQTNTVVTAAFWRYKKTQPNTPADVTEQAHYVNLNLVKEVKVDRAGTTVTLTMVDAEDIVLREAQAQDFLAAMEAIF